MVGLGKRSFASLVLSAAVCGSAWGQMVVPPGSSIDLAGGSFQLPCTAVVMQGELTLGTGSFDTGSFAFDSGASVTGTGATERQRGPYEHRPVEPWDQQHSPVGQLCARFCPAAERQHRRERSHADQHHSHPAHHRLAGGHQPDGSGTLTLGTPGRPVVLTSSGPGTAVVTMGPGATLSNPSGSAVPGNVQIGAPVVTSPASIPTLSTYGLMLMSLMLGGLALARQRRSRTTL